MSRTNLISLSFLAALSLVAPAANAWPLGRLLHLHPAETSVTDSRISFQLVNKSGIIQDLDINGKKYTLMPNSGIAITAPAGTQVISQSVGQGHTKGDVLFAVQPSLRDNTVTLR